jgi:hypothetical protein
LIETYINRRTSASKGDGTKKRETEIEITYTHSLAIIKREITREPTNCYFYFEEKVIESCVHQVQVFIYSPLKFSLFETSCSHLCNG